MFTQESLELVRNVKSFDNIALATGVMMHGLAKSRNGVTYPFEMDTSDAAIFAGGFKPIEYQEFLLRKEFDYAADQEFREKRKYYNRRFKLALTLMAQDDSISSTRGESMIREIAGELNLDPSLSPKQKWTLRKNFLKENKNELADLVRGLIDRGRTLEAQNLTSTIDIFDEKEDN
jgi:hypothetical protein